MKNVVKTIHKNQTCAAGANISAKYCALTALILLLSGIAIWAQTTVYSDDFNRATLSSGGFAYTITTNTGGGNAYIVGGTTLWLTNGTPAGQVSVATNVPAGNGFSPTLDNSAGLVTWTFNLRFGRASTPSGFTSGNYGVGYILAGDNVDFSALNSKGYAILFGNTGSPDAFRLVAFTNGIKADYLAVGSAAGNTLIAGTGAFSTTTQAQATEYYSFQVTYDPATKIWTFYGRDDGSSAFADPASGTFTTIGTFTETTPIFRATALGRTGAFWNHSTGANNPSQFDNFKLTVIQPGIFVATDNTGTPATGNIAVANNSVPVLGFQLTPSGGSVNFTGLKLTTAGTATASDLNTFRVIYDADNSGTFNAGDIEVSSSAQSLANPINFTITGQTGFSTARRYLVVANVSGVATVGRTLTGSIAVAADITTTGTPSGTAAGNPQTIIAAAYDLTMAAVASSESTTISSLINDATITTTSQGAQVLQVTFDNPAGNAGVANISALSFTQGANNTVASWSNAIQAAELFNGSTPLAAGTISSTNIAFSGLSLNVPQNGSQTLSLRISLKSTAGALVDNAIFQFALAADGVTVSGNGVVSAPINSDQTKNIISVVATRLVFTSVPTYVVTNANFSVTVQAQDANGNRDLDSVTSVTVSVNTGAGTLGSSTTLLSLAAGTKNWSIYYDTLSVFTLKADDGILTPAISSPLTARITPTLAEVIMPQYIQGLTNGSTNNKRLPFAYCVTISNLTASAAYRYYNQCVSSADNANANGAGNVIFASASGNFVETSGATLSTAGNYGNFTTDANGNYTGWFITEPTANARFTNSGAQVFMRIFLNDGAGGTFINTRLTTLNSASVLPFGTDSTSGTAIHGSSSATAKNFVVLYDNTAGTGRPLAATFVEDDGFAENTGGSFASFYSTTVDGVAGAWGTIIPNANANGIQRIEQRSLAGAILVAFNTDNDGIWPSGANTVNPSGADTTSTAITFGDAPLASATATTPIITGIRVTGGNVLIDFTAGASDTAGSFSVVGTTNLLNALAPVSASVSTLSTGVFRATIAATATNTFYRIKH